MVAKHIINDAVHNMIDDAFQASTQEEGIEIMVNAGRLYLQLRDEFIAKYRQ